ncbi:MAG: hypothetical protein ACRBN8_10235 [Nannocystales bacterium]
MVEELRRSAAKTGRVATFALLMLASCRGPLLGPRAYDSRRTRPGKTTPEDIARVMVEKDTYIVISTKRDEVLVRRCTTEGEDGTCDVAWLVGRQLEHSYTGTTMRAGLPTVLVHELADPIADRIASMDGRVLNARQRDVRAGELHGPEEGSAYRFQLDETRLSIVYRAGSGAPWGTRVAEVQVDNSAGTVTSYITHDEYGLFALQLRHGDEAGGSTSWLLFERQGSGPGGKVWTIPSPSGAQATVISNTPTRVPLPRSAPSSVPTKDPPPAQPPAQPEASTTARACRDVSDCEPGERCQSPQAHRWNNCGAPRKPSCDEGFLGDSCGNCFETCTSDVDCSEGHCNGAWCESASVCGKAELHQ